MRLSFTLLIVAALAEAQGNGLAQWKKRLTGEDLDTHARWDVAGTDLGIPFVLENGAIGYLFGDTYGTQFPGGENWRSPVMLRSASHPGEPDGIVFDSAAGVVGDSPAQDLFYNGKGGDDGAGSPEHTVIPNDGIGFDGTGPHKQVISYMSFNHWDEKDEFPGGWVTNYAGLAVSDDGNEYRRTEVVWRNNEQNTDPFQMWTMQQDGDWVYVFSVRAGRQHGPMVLQRVPAAKIMEKEAYEGWGWNGNDWGWDRAVTPLFDEATYGEPSVRKLSDGTWAMAYLKLDGFPTIVTRTASGPNETWSEEKVQLTHNEEHNLYGGFIHPWSTSKPNDLHMMVSRWTKTPGDEAYHVSQFVGTL